MKKFVKIGALLMAAVMSFSVLTACGAAPTEEPAPAAEEPAAEEPADEEPAAEEPAVDAGDADTFVYNISAMVKTIDPALNNAVDGAIVLGNMFEGLYRLGEGDVPEPGQAESYDISEDLKTYTFYLREGLKWSDGEPLTAHDFEYAWKRALAPETAAEYAYLMFYIEGGEAYNSGEGSADDVKVKALDDLTLEVTLIAPTKYFLSLAAFPTYYPVREDIVSADPERWALSADTYISNGMYRMVELNDKVNFLIEANPNYWNADIVKMQYCDLKLIEDINSGYATFQAGELDMQDLVPPAEIQPGVDSGVVQIFPYTGTYFMIFNMDEPKAAGVSPEAAEVMQDVKVRQALSLAIDRPAITEFVRKDGSTPAYAYVPDAIMDSNGTSFAQTEYFKPEGDPVLAQQLLAEAGFPNGEGFPKLIYGYNAGAGHEQIAQAMQGMWKDVLNIDVELQNSEWAAFQTARDNHDYIMARHGWIADYNDPTTFLEMWLSNSGQNNIGYNNPEYDALLKAAQQETDGPKRDELLHQAEDMLMADWVLSPIFFYTNPKAIQPYVQGLRVSPLGFVFWDQVVLDK